MPRAILLCRRWKEWLIEDKCPKCGEMGYPHVRFVWNSSHLNGKYYVYFKHKGGIDHYGHPTDSTKRLFNIFYPITDNTSRTKDSDNNAGH